MAISSKQIETWANKALAVGSYPVVLGGSYLLASLTWFLVIPSSILVPQTDQKPGLTPLTSSPSADKAVDINELIGWHLFGKYQAYVAPKKTEPVKPTVAPVTRLKIELVGVFMADEPADSTAVISEKGSTGKLYGINDVIPGNARLEAVYADRVVLRRSGRLETLYFPGKQSPNVKITQTSASGQASIQQNPSAVSAVRRGVDDAAGNLIPLLEQDQVSPDALVKAMHQDLQNNKEETLSNLGLDFIEGASGTHVKVTSRTPPQLRQLLGLRPGDVLISVGGYPAGQLAGDPSLIKQLTQNQKLEVEVERNKRRFKVNVKVPAGIKL